jgi:hypothetical protein
MNNLTEGNKANEDPDETEGNNLFMLLHALHGEKQCQP